MQFENPVGSIKKLKSCCSQNDKKHDMVAGNKATYTCTYIFKISLPNACTNKSV